MARSLVRLLITTGLVLIGTVQASSSSFRGLFDVPKNESTSRRSTLPPSSPSQPTDTGSALKGYRTALSRNDLTLLNQFEKYVKSSGTTLGELTTKHHVAAANCILAPDGAPDPTASQAARCLSRAAEDFNRVLLAGRYPDYVQRHNQDFPSSGH